MRMMRLSLIITVFNEQGTIAEFIKSVINQSLLPDEFIIVDGGSSDSTVAKIKSHPFGKLRTKVKNYIGKFEIIVKKGNRAVGRNEAIRTAKNEIVVCSDAGCVLDKNWIKNIVEPFNDPKVDVVAGYYRGLSKTIFEKCLIPYVLVMPDKVNSQNFLPASRSMAFRKTIWKKVGGFSEGYSHNEDYVFAQKLKKEGVKIVFKKDAVVYWRSRENIKEAFIMFFRFALGDSESGIWRSKVLLLFARYFVGFYFIFLSLLYKSFISISILFVAFMLYVFWSIKKNYKYVKEKKAIKILLLLQLTADIAVLSGSIVGFLKAIVRFNYLNYFKKNKFLFLIISVYTGILFLTLKWGIPNLNHPFPYHMDEWHQLQAVANTFRYGTPNTEGSANGTMFHFLISGFYLVPFTLLKIIDPFVLQIDNLFMRERIFMILRLQTIFFGALSIFYLYKIAELLNASKKLVIFLFTFTPIWLMLSGYFKYDIALIFWIILSLLFLLRFAKNPSNKNFLIAAIPSSLAVAVKVSAIPIFIIYIFSYFMFSSSRKKNSKYLFIGICMFVFTLLISGFPDTLFGKGNILHYLYNNIIESRQVLSNINLNVDPLFYLLIRHYPLMFGHGLIFIFIASLIVLIHNFFKKSLRKSLEQYKIEFFLLACLLIFYISLLTIKLASAGNRSLVLLPFLTLIIGVVFKKIQPFRRSKILVTCLIAIVIIAQMYESFSWTYMKIVKSPQEISSEWIKSNIAKDEKIGIENIPIYQSVPDIIQKEFYFNQYKVKNNNMYRYELINSKSNKLPSIIVVTSDDMEGKLIKTSAKKDLAKRLRKEGYKKVVVFSPDFKYYKALGNEEDFYLAGIVTIPVNTSIYKK